MANLKASKKGIIVAERNRQRNIANKSKMKTMIRQVKAAVAGKQENAAEKLKEALKVIDKTAAKGTIKKQAAARKKSRLVSGYNATVS